MTRTVGVILAGGRGSRLGGVIKANIEIGGITLIDRLAATLLSQCDIVIVSAGQLLEEDFKTQYTLPIFSDLDTKELGPVAGLTAAVNWVQTHHPDISHIVTAAVDTPFYPADFVTRALPLMVDDIDCVIGRSGDQPYPTNALWRVHGISHLPREARESVMPNGLKNVVRKNQKRYLDYSAAAFKHSFFNINEPKDVAIAERLLTLL